MGQQDKKRHFQVPVLVRSLKSSNVVLGLESHTSQAELALLFTFRRSYGSDILRAYGKYVDGQEMWKIVSEVLMAGPSSLA